MVFDRREAVFFGLFSFFRRQEAPCCGPAYTVLVLNANLGTVRFSLT